MSCIEKGSIGIPELPWHFMVPKAGFEPARVSPPPPQERSIVGTYLADSVMHDPEVHLCNVKQLVEWLAAGKVKPVISERVPLSEAAAAMKRMINRQVKGKVVILPEA